MGEGKELVIQCLGEFIAMTHGGDVPSIVRADARKKKKISKIENFF